MERFFFSLLIKAFSDHTFVGIDVMKTWRHKCWVSMKKIFKCQHRISIDVIQIRILWLPVDPFRFRLFFWKYANKSENEQKSSHTESQIRHRWKSKPWKRFELECMHCIAMFTYTFVDRYKVVVEGKEGTLKNYAFDAISWTTKRRQRRQQRRKNQLNMHKTKHVLNSFNGRLIVYCVWAHSVNVNRTCCGNQNNNRLKLRCVFVFQ